MVFKPIKPSKYFDDKIAKQIISWEWEFLYKPILDVLKPNYVENDKDIILTALKNGTIYYQDGAFYSKTGRFSNKIALELEKIGAKYSKYTRTYRIALDKLPSSFIWIIETNAAKVYSSVSIIKKILDFSLNNIEEALKYLKVDFVAKEMFLDLQKRTIDNFRKNKIQTISPELTDFKANQLAKNYTENLEFYIKKWQPEEIIKMREVVGQMSIDGKSLNTIANYIQNQFKVSQRKAKFLARNESSIATTEYLSAKYQEEGFTHFKWITNFDGRERELHKELGQEHNNKYGINKTNIFRFDNPPVIYEDTKRGIIQKGLPSETYNCRCSMVPVISKDMIENRKLFYNKKKLPLF